MENINDLLARIKTYKNFSFKHPDVNPYSLAKHGFAVRFNDKL